MALDRVAWSVSGHSGHLGPFFQTSQVLAGLIPSADFDSICDGRVLHELGPGLSCIVGGAVRLQSGYCVSVDPCSNYQNLDRTCNRIKGPENPTCVV